MIPKKPPDPAAAGEALKFFSWAYAHGGEMAEALDYVSLPESVVKAVEKMWASNIKDGSGKPLFAN